MFEASIITTGRHDGVTVELKVLPNHGDTFCIEHTEYRVVKVRHHIGRLYSKNHEIDLELELL